MVCKTCRHPKHREIDRALLEGATHKQISAKYHMDPKSVYRHRKNHLGKLIAEHASRYGENLVEQLYAMTVDTKRIGKKAEAARQYGPALGAIGTERGIIELVARLTGQLDNRAQIILLEQAEAANAEQELMLSRLTLDERRELRRLIAKAEGRPEEAIETDYQNMDGSDGGQLHN